MEQGCCFYKNTDLLWDDFMYFSSRRKTLVVHASRASASGKWELASGFKALTLDCVFFLRDLWLEDTQGNGNLVQI